MRTLETERLALRELTPDDAEFIVAQLNDLAFIRNVVEAATRSSRCSPPLRSIRPRWRPRCR